MKEEKLYMSKSKMKTYENCPYGYKLSYIDKHKGGNIYTEIGEEVHDFIDKLFTIIKPNISTMKLDNLSEVKLFPNVDYKKNVLIMEANRWNNICKLNISDKEKLELFNPIISEVKMYDEKNELVGIVDRVHKVYYCDPFAPNHSEFKDGDLVIVENKTGVYTKKKAVSYEEELLWYRIMIKETKGLDIRWGAIYFPHNNKVHFIDLNEEKFNQNLLLDRINKIRKNINDRIFLPMPETRKCNSCFYWEFCEYKK